jgi:hypothetical protein
MKQIALAMGSYHDAHGRYPCGTVVESAEAPEERLSWLVALLPHLEQAPLSKEFDEEAGWAESSNQKAAQTSIKIFHCSGQHGRDWDRPWPRTSYVGIAGVGADAPSFHLKDPGWGVFGHERRVARKDVTDGTSMTMFLLETAEDKGLWAAGGSATVRPIDPARQPYLTAQGPFGMEHSNPLFWQITRQPVETMAAMLDGSVRSLSDDISPRTLEALATIAGGEEIEDPNF